MHLNSRQKFGTDFPPSFLEIWRTYILEGQHRTAIKGEPELWKYVHDTDMWQRVKREYWEQHL